MQVLEAELVGIDSDLLHKLPPEVARQLSQKAIVTAAAQTAGNGVAAPMDLLRRTTSKNSGREFASESQQYTPYEHPGALGRNLSVNTNSSRRVSKTPSSLAGPNDGWRFTNDEVATHPQNTWQYPSESGAAFKGLNYGSNSPPQPQMDPAGLKYATKQVQQEYRHMQEAGEEEEPPQWNVHQHVAPVTDSQAAEMYHKSMDWRQRNKLRWGLAHTVCRCAYAIHPIHLPNVKSMWCCCQCAICLGAEVEQTSDDMDCTCRALSLNVTFTRQMLLPCACHPKHRPIAATCCCLPCLSLPNV